MRHRVVCIAAVVLASLVGDVRPATAGDWYDVLEALTGPGPFKHKRPFPVNHLAVTGFCFGPSKDGAPAYSILGRSSGISDQVPCLFFDFVGYHVDQAANKHGNFGDVDLDHFEVGVSFQLHRPFEIGAALGVARFESGGVVTKKPTFTPLRFLVKPLYFLPDRWGNLRSHDWPGFLKIEVREMILGGPLTGDMFGSTAAAFNIEHDYLTSVGSLVIDVGPIVADVIRKAKRQLY
jgi:hypothetical protein